MTAVKEKWREATEKQDVLDFDIECTLKGSFDTEHF